MPDISEKELTKLLFIAIKRVRHRGLVPPMRDKEVCVACWKEVKLIIQELKLGPLLSSEL